MSDRAHDGARHARDIHGRRASGVASAVHPRCYEVLDPRDDFWPARPRQRRVDAGAALAAQVRGHRRAERSAQMPRRGGDGEAAAYRPLEQRAGHAPVQRQVHAEAVADALVCWPRIARGMLDVAKGAQAPAFTCSATRVWVRFAPRPRLRHGYDGKRDALYEYCASRPRPPAWMMRALRILGKLYCSLPQRQRTVSCFNQMDELVQQRLHTWFTQEQPLNAEALSEVRKFMNEVVSTTFAAGPRVGRNLVNKSPTKDTGEELLFARACVSLAEWIVEHQMALNEFFSGACSDEKGDTVERTALAKALKARRVRLVRWRDWRTMAPPATRHRLPAGVGARCQRRGDIRALLSFEAHAQWTCRGVCARLVR